MHMRPYVPPLSTGGPVWPGWKIDVEHCTLLLYWYTLLHYTTILVYTTALYYSTGIHYCTLLLYWYTLLHSTRLLVYTTYPRHFTCILMCTLLNVPLMACTLQNCPGLDTIVVNTIARCDPHCRITFDCSWLAKNT